MTMNIDHKLSLYELYILEAIVIIVLLIRIFDFIIHGKSKLKFSHDLYLPCNELLKISCQVLVNLFFKFDFS